MTDHTTTPTRRPAFRPLRAATAGLVLVVAGGAFATSAGADEYQQWDERETEQWPTTTCPEEEETTTTTTEATTTTTEATTTTAAPTTTEAPATTVKAAVLEATTVPAPAAVVVADPADPAELAVTGSSSGVLTATGFSLLLAGALLLRRSARSQA